MKIIPASNCPRRISSVNQPFSRRRLYTHVKRGLALEVLSSDLQCQQLQTVALALTPLESVEISKCKPVLELELGAAHLLSRKLRALSTPDALGPIACEVGTQT